MSNISTIESNLEKNKQLLEIIVKMSISNIDEETTIEELKSIYTNDFRHSYSMIAKKLHDMDSDERDIVSEGMSHIVESLIHFEKSQGINSKDYEPLINGIIKLNDHINLEIIRIQLDTQASEKLRDAIFQSDSMKEANAILEEDISVLNEQVWNLNNQAESSNTQSITILSIFAGIVFVFTGGFSLVSTALQNINEASVYKITFTLSIVGMLIYNLIFLFFYMVSRMTQKDISASCIKTSSHWCDCDEEYCSSCHGIKRFIRKFWYTIIPNAFLLVFMVGTVIIWLLRH